MLHRSGRQCIEERKKMSWFANVPRRGPQENSLHASRTKAWVRNTPGVDNQKTFRTMDRVIGPRQSKMFLDKPPKKRTVDLFKIHRNETKIVNLKKHLYNMKEQEDAFHLLWLQNITWRFFSFGLGLDLTYSNKDWLVDKIGFHLLERLKRKWISLGLGTFVGWIESLFWISQ